MKRQVLITSSLGNIFDAYDANLYAVFAMLLAPTFFPNTDPFIALLSSMMVFSTSFLTRPIGAIVFGHLGDRYGRKKALGLCMILMAIPTLMIGLLPPYSAIGIAAPIVLILCRLMQGLCSGGELNGAIIFSIEHNNARFAGRVAGFIAATGILGVLLAMGIGALMTQPYMPHWAWRLAFIAGGVICIFGAILRYRLGETPEFQAACQNQHTVSAPLKTAILQHWKAFIVVLLKSSALAALSFTLIAYLVIYLQKSMGFAPHIAKTYCLVGLFAFMVFAYVGGRLYDHVPNQRPLLITHLVLILLNFPIFLGIQSGIPFLMIPGLIAFGSLTGLVAGTGYPLIQRLFPTPVRYSGLSLAFTLGGTLCGGTIPIALVALNHYFPHFPSAPLILSSLSLLFIAVYMGIRPSLNPEA